MAGKKAGNPLNRFFWEAVRRTGGGGSQGLLLQGSRRIPEQETGIMQ